MRPIRYQLVWQGAIYEPLTISEIVMGQWEVDGFMYKDHDGNLKGDKVSIPRKDYIFFAEEENDFGVWRESTGLTDRSGVEIFEGDIVSGKKYGFGDRKWVITWTTDLEYCGFVPREVGKDSLSNFISWGNFEVIGNIYCNYPDI